jgi:hypothetical protein
MKKILLFAVLISLAVSSFSQPGNSAFNNAVYIRASYSMPGGTLKTDKVISGGAQFEVGTIFYINSLNLPEKLKLGIDATYLSFTGLFNSSAIKDSNETVSFFTAGAKVGPCLSYNFAPDWFADVYFKIHPNYFIVGQKDLAYAADNQFKIGTSFGLNVRWKVLMIGCEFTSAKYSFDLVNPLIDGILPVRESKSIKLPITNISLGVNF